jgi:hypothetical protein
MSSKPIGLPLVVAVTLMAASAASCGLKARRHRVARTAAPATAASVATPATADADEPFTCEAPRREAAPRQRVFTDASGPVRALRLPDLAPPAGREQVEASRLFVRAESASLGDVAAEIARALGVEATVDAPLLDTRITLRAAGLRVDETLDLIRSRYPLCPRVGRRGQLVFMPLQYDRCDLVVDLTPSTTRLLDAGDPARARQLAAVYCELVAGERGSATAIGSSVLLEGSRHALELAEGLSRQSRASPRGSSQAFTCRAEPIAPREPLPPGRADAPVVVERVDEGPPPSSTEDLESVRLRVDARGASVDRFGLALAEALDISAVVTFDRVGSSVFAQASDAPATQVLGSLLAPYRLATKLEDGVLALSPSQLTLPLPTFTEVRIVRLPPHVVAREVASAWCHQLGSSLGRAAALGDSVVLRDTPDSLMVAERLVPHLK